MALTLVQNLETFAASGTPNSDTEWDLLDFGFKSEGVKIVIPTGTVDVSMNGKDVFFQLGPSGADPTQYDFVGMHIPRVWIRNTTATDVKVIAWSGE